MADIKDFKHAIVRQKILDAVRKDLIGPTSDCEQLNEVPTSSYITGLLYPADTDVTEDENYNDVEFTEKNFDADGETLEAGIFEEEEPEDRVKGGFQKPSSIGVSFYVSDDVQKVNAYINWGKYYAEQVQGEVIDENLEEDAENKKKKKHTIYIREQMNDVVEIDFNEMGRSKQISLESNGNVYIYVMKMQLDNGYKMVSVYLHNNDMSDGDEKEYEKVMFQVEMLIADDLMSPIFVPEYLCRKVELEDEYYYKGRPVYARGRGCAATWEKKAGSIMDAVNDSLTVLDIEYWGTNNIGKEIRDARLASYMNVRRFFMPKTGGKEDIPVVSFPYYHVCSKGTCKFLFDMRDYFDMDQYKKNQGEVKCPKCGFPAYP